LFLGLGVGAGHACGLAFPSELMKEHHWLILGTKTMIDAGFVLAGFVPLVLYCIFGEQHLCLVCGLSLGFGAIPAFVVLWKIAIPFYHMLEQEKHVPDCNCEILLVGPKEVCILNWLSLKWCWKSVLGLSLAWFIYDFIMYVHFAIYSSMITNNVTGGILSISIVLGWTVLINLFRIPGTVLGTYLIDYLGVRATMVVGSFLQAILGLTIGMYTPLTNHIAAFAVVYGIFLTLGEVGPGSCLRVLAAKTGPSACISGQIYSVAGAIGKVGALIGTWVFPQIIDAFGGSKTVKGSTGPFWIGSGVAILSVIVTFVLQKPLTLDGRKADNKAFHQYLEENGFVFIPASDVRASAEEVMCIEVDKWQ
ncbi:major facilitator superfamily domain-containing protein, partial [Pisolithus tinctorius]